MKANSEPEASPTVRPSDLIEYHAWLRKRHGIEITDRMKNHYDVVATKMKLDFERSRFWQELLGNLREYDARYTTETGYPLLYQPDKLPEIEKKPWKSFQDKTYRKNVVENSKWPEEPPYGWVLPANWYSEIKDILRTSIVVKYLDGVKFIVDETDSLCKKCSMGFDCDWEAREKGYYAAHMSIKQEFEVPRIDWDTEKITACVEIKVTTQIKEVIGQLTHKYYEERRSRIVADPGLRWQWDYESDEFAPNYLGHILHYVEGMIMEIRNRGEVDEEVSDIS